MPSPGKPPPGSFTPADFLRGVWFRFRLVVEMHPFRIAVRDDATALTYAALAACALDVAQDLRTATGPRPLPVALVRPRRPRPRLHGRRPAVGAASAGPRPGFPAARHRAVVLRTGATVVASDRSQAALARQVAGPESVTILTPDRDPERDGTSHRGWAACAAIDPAAPALIATTSGSTGAPKLVISDHRQLVAEARAAGPANDCLGEDDVLGLTLPVAFAGGLSATLTALLTGATLALYEARRRGSGRMDQWIADSAVTVLVTAPTALRTLVAGAPDPALLTPLRSVVLLGEAATGKDVVSARTVLPPACKIRHRYGSTETGLVSELVLTANDTPPPGRLPVGHVVGSTQVEILDDAGTPLPTGAVGAIAIRRSTMALGYWDDPPADAAQFLATTDGTRVFRSHDRGHLDPDGTLHVLGRADTCVKILGYLVDPAQVENALLELPDIAEAAVLTQDLHGRHRLIAYAVPRPPAPHAEAALSQSIRRRLRFVLPEYMIPARVVQLPALPRNPFGKVDRAALPQPTDPADGAAARDDTGWESRMARIWARALQRDQVPHDADFITLGGDSLAAQSVIAQVQNLIDLPEGEISSALLGQAPTLALFADRLRRRAGQPPT